MLDATAVANDVSQAIYEVIMQQLSEIDDHHLALVPRRVFEGNRQAWAVCLARIFETVRRRYPLLPANPTRTEVFATWHEPLLITQQLLVGKILSPSPRMTRLRPKPG